MPGTVLTAQERLAADVAGVFHSVGQAILLDFVTIYGTALSAPLFLLVAQAGLTVSAPRPGRLEGVGVAGLTLIGVASIGGQIGEPIFRHMLRPATFDWAPATVVAFNLATALGMLVFRGLEWRQRRRAVLRGQADAPGRMGRKAPGAQGVRPL